MSGSSWGPEGLRGVPHSHRKGAGRLEKSLKLSRGTSGLHEGEVGGMAQEPSFAYEFKSAVPDSQPSRGLPTQAEKSPSVKFSTSGGETARSGVRLQRPAGGAAAPHAASRGRRPRGRELGGVGLRVRGPGEEAGRLEWEVQGCADTGCVGAPAPGP